MNEPAKFNNVVSFLWAIADLLNGAFKKSEFQKIILPFTVLRRLDYALEKTKAKVLETEHTLKEKGLENRHGQLCRAAGYAFYNTSKFTYESLLHDDANLALNLRQYVMGFSPNVREIFAAFNFDDTIRDLGRVNLLYLLMERFNEKSKVDLRPAAMSNHEMGYVFEHLLRKFNEALNENPGEHFTPRDGIRLMVDLVLMLDTALAGNEAVTRTVNDCGCGTGGILSITKDHILQINPLAKVFLYGQELNPFTWAIARADMLILEPEGKDAENIKLGSTLSNDPLRDKRFDFQLVNPPYGDEWSKDFDAVTTEAARGFDGRFGAGLPRKSVGQMLFLQHFIQIAVVFLALFCGGVANGANGESIVGRVVGVHDGDTITVLTAEKNSVKIRLEGIDAPELKQAFGSKSKAELSGLVFGKEVIVADKGTDRYKRTLGRVACNGADVNLEMVKRGMAWRYVKYSKEPALISGEKEARAAGRGLWAEDKAIPPWIWRSKKNNLPSSGDAHENSKTKFQMESQLKHNRMHTTQNEYLTGQTAIDL